MPDLLNVEDEFLTLKSIWTKALSICMKNTVFTVLLKQEPYVHDNIIVTWL